ncbi:MAG TPA: aromatic aminobenezylarsenical efflux permease ArsG family transporter [Bacteroidales bacterium]|jgi:cytochrome c biogenesis protein CcdA|nr:aromatic aminobenezylarsenical efflux permease ArsG family transporter [Bacteroidales bacterium]
MEFLQNLIDQSSVPLLTAFLLGLMTVISPCPLATNITALAYIGKDVESRRTAFLNGLYYTLGRAITYTGIGLILFFGASKFHVSRAIQSNGEKWIGPLLVIIGILMLDIIRLPGSSGSLMQRFADKVKLGTGWGALLLGILFALAFCPYSGVLYFGMLIPMVLANTSGLLLLPTFAVATGLPVIMLAYFIAFSISSVAKMYNKIKTFEVWFRRFVAGLFILTGMYFIWIYFI